MVLSDVPNTITPGDSVVLAKKLLTPDPRYNFRKDPPSKACRSVAGPQSIQLTVPSLVRSMKPFEPCKDAEAFSGFSP